MTRATQNNYSTVAKAVIPSRKMFGLLLLGGAVLAYGPSFAVDDQTLPSGGVVTGGAADFNYSTPGQLHIDQHSDRVIIDWNSFNIGKNALTQFHQNSSSSIAVNRVSGSFEPTKILGTLKANGQIVILDQNGVIFGVDSRVDVGGIIASTGRIDDAAFMGGAVHLDLLDMTGTGAIVNHGQISVGEAGLAAFVAPTVVNNGIISAKLGRVALASGTAATVDLYGDGLVELAAPALGTGLIDNKGEIIAEGGIISMSARVVRDIVDTVINTSGIINASSATQEGGTIILEGPTINVSGTLDASGKTGGGTIHVGGGWQGKDTKIVNAEKVDVTETAQIKANTTGTDGDGGEVVLWSDGDTKFDGSIEAKGGSVSGDGGQVETSGKINLRVTGSVDAGANNANGKAGDWLLDPQNVRITNSGNAVPTVGGVYDPNGAGNPYIILDSSISAALSNGNNVTITTNNNAGHEGSITFDNATILKSGGGDATFTAKADHNIYTDGINSISSTDGKLNVVFWADANNDGNIGNQAIWLTDMTIQTNGGNFYLGGGLDDGADILDGLGNVVIEGIAGDGLPDHLLAGGTTAEFAINLQRVTIDTGEGDVTMLGKASSGAGARYGVRVEESTITTTDGNVVIVGEGGDANGADGDGVVLEVDTSIISSEGGSISVYGKGGTSTTGVAPGMSLWGNVLLSVTDGDLLLSGQGGENGYGVYLDGDLKSTGMGSITVNAVGDTASSTNRDGLYVESGRSIMATGSGSISLQGQSYGAHGVNLENATVSTVDGDIDIEGTGGSGSDWYFGVRMNSTSLTTGGGDIFVKGTGGITSGMANALGILVENASDISTLGHGSITLEGTGGVGFWEASGIYITQGSVVSVADGDITLTGVGGTADPAYTAGIYLDDSQILSSGNGTITIDATYAAGTDFYTNQTIGGASATGNQIYIADEVNLDTNTNIQTTGSVLFKTRTAGRDIFLGTNGAGLTLSDAALSRIDAGTLIIGDSAGETGDIVVDSWDLSGKTHDVELYGNDITFRDTDNTGGVDYAVNLGSGNFMAHAKDRIGDAALLAVNAAIQKLGIGTSLLELRSDTDIALNAGHITASTGKLDVVLWGDADNGGLTGNENIRLNNVNIRTNGGDFYVGGGLDNGADILDAQGNVIITGTAGDGRPDHLLVAGSNAPGAIQLERVTVDTGEGDITILGKGSSGAGGRFGVEITNSSITTSDGNILIVGEAGSTSAGNSEGVVIGNNSTINATGTGSISIHGLGGTSANGASPGISIWGGVSIGVADGDLLLSGQSGQVGRWGSYGIYLDGNLTSTGAGSITVKAVGDDSAGSEGADGLFLENGSSIISTGNGSIYLEGTAQAGHGISMRNATISATDGNIGISGKAEGTGAGWYYGLFVDGSSITTIDGDISMEGQGATSTGGDGFGILVDNGSNVASTGAGSILMHGKGGAGVQSASGIRLWNNALISVADGSITLNGENGTGLAISSFGVELNGAGVISNGNGTITINAESSYGSALHVNNVIGGAAATGDQFYITDTVYMNVDANLQTTGSVLFRPKTATQDIYLGTLGAGLSFDNNGLSQINAGALIIGDAVNGTGNIIIDTWDLSGKTHAVQLFGNALNLNGITLGSGDVTAYAKGDITVGAASASNAGGDLNLIAAGNIAVNDTVSNSGAGAFRLFAGWDGTSGITTPAAFDIADIDFGAAVRNVTIGINGAISSAANGTAVLVAATGNFINNATVAANAIVTNAGRYLVYGTHPDDTDKGGLTAKNLYNASYAGNAPSTIAGGSRFIFTHQPTLTLTADDVTVNDPSQAVYSFTLSGLLGDDLLADALSGAASYGLGPLVGSTHEIQISGNYTSDLGYNIVYQNGVMTLLSPPVVTPPSTPTPVPPPTIIHSIANAEASTQLAQAEELTGKDGGESKRKGVSCWVINMRGQCLVN